MSRKIHFTKKQVNEICNRIDEINGMVNLNTAQNFQKMPIDNAVEITQKMAQANPSYGFTLDGQQINTSTNPQIKKQEIINNAKDVVDGYTESKHFYTKKQLKEAKLRYLKEHSSSYSKKDFKNRFIKN